MNIKYNELGGATFLHIIITVFEIRLSNLLARKLQN